MTLPIENQNVRGRGRHFSMFRSTKSHCQRNLSNLFCAVLFSYMVICPNILDSIPFLSTQTKMDSFPVLSLILHLDSFPFQFLSISKIQKKLSKIFPNSSKILRFHYRCLKCLLGNPCGLSQGKLFPISYENLRLLVLRY